MKLPIKVKFVDFWSGCDYDRFILLRALREQYDVVCDDADYVFYSVFGTDHWFIPDRCVKIFYTGENICPDFNACDYAFGFEHLDYGDRYMRLPNYYATPHYVRPTLMMETKHELPCTFDLKHDKPDFCSFVVSNGGGNPMRRQMFDALSEYKRVDSGGRYINNVGAPVTDKFSFESRHKFSIAFENSSHPGYCTEKIVEAMAARTVPIYWGDPLVATVFNPKAFVNVADYPSLDAVIARIRALDADDAAYLAMLREPALLPAADRYAVLYERVCAFMEAIVEQPLDRAYRRNREGLGRDIINRERKLILDSKKSISQRLREKFLRE